MEELLKQIQEDIDGCRRLARKNYYAAYALFVLALGGTVAATFISASDSRPWIRALVTAVPGFVVLIHGTLKFQQKSRWYWNRVRKFEALVRKAKFEGVGLVELSREFSSSSQKLEEEWPTFEPLPTQPPSPNQGGAG
jgi:alpha-beta hydrolase superfamily lysophospholipase